MAAQRYQHCHGVTPEQMAAVAQKNRRHAMHNPRAQHAGELTIEEILASRPIADPLTLLQCCDISDAAAAAVVGPPRRAGSGGDSSDVTVRATELASGALWDHTSDLVWGWQLVADTATGRLRAPRTPTPPTSTCSRCTTPSPSGRSSRPRRWACAVWATAASSWHRGTPPWAATQPVNPSGGLLARGHPLGATGLGQIAEIVWQLRGAAGGRQVPGARLGVVETMGGGTAGIDGNACVVAVLEAPGTPA